MSQHARQTMQELTSARANTQRGPGFPQFSIGEPSRFITEHFGCVGVPTAIRTTVDNSSCNVDSPCSTSCVSQILCAGVPMQVSHVTVLLGCFAVASCCLVAVVCLCKFHTWLWCWGVVLEPIGAFLLVCAYAGFTCVCAVALLWPFAACWLLCAYAGFTCGCAVGVLCWGLLVAVCCCVPTKVSYVAVALGCCPRCA
jgi:hypothetical protein